MRYNYFIKHTSCTKEIYNIMKSFKFIPVLAVAALLSACGTSKATVSAKAPKFAKEGKEVEVAKFSEDAVAAISKIEYLDDEAKIGSKEVKVKNSAVQSSTITRNKKEAAKQEIKKSEEVVAQFDMKNNVCKAINKSAQSTLFKVSYGYNEQYNEETETMYMQEAQYEGETWIVRAAVEAKQTTLMAKTESMPMETVLQLSVRDCVDTYFELSDMSSFIQVMPSMPSESLEHYKFYENGSVYTITYTDEQSTEMMSEDNVIVAKMTNKAVNKIQFEIKEGSIALRSMMESTTTTTYLEDTSSYLKGDVLESKTNQYAEVSAKDYKKNVKALNLEGYEFLSL